MTQQVVGRMFGSETWANKLDNGSWEVTISMTEQRKISGGDWEKKVLSETCEDPSFEKAYAISLEILMGKFNEAITKTTDSSLFNKLTDD